MQHALFVPLLSLVLWSFVMQAWLYATRIPEVVKMKIVFDPGQPAEVFQAQLSPQTRWKADNYNHLMEQPTLFYAVVLALILLEPQASAASLFLAWAYVGLRVVHSLVQALVNRIIVRFALFMASSAVLLALAAKAMWAAL